jgi:hypothetical protein
MPKMIKKADLPQKKPVWHVACRLAGVKNGQRIGIRCFTVQIGAGRKKAANPASLFGVCHVTSYFNTVRERGLKSVLALTFKP